MRSSMPGQGTLFESADGRVPSVDPMGVGSDTRASLRGRRCDEFRRGSRFVSPMPVRLGVEARLRVSDQAGRIVRTEALPAGTDLHERLALAHENYARQGWTVGERHPE